MNYETLELYGSLFQESTHTGQLNKEGPADLGHCHWGAVVIQSLTKQHNVQLLALMKISMGPKFMTTGLVKKIGTPRK